MAVVKMIVREIKPLATTKTNHGNEGTLYEVFAVKEDGEAITESLRTFEALPLDQVIEVDSKRYEHTRYGVSYTLKRVKKGGGGGGGGGGLANSVDQLRQRVDGLEQQMAEATSRLELLISRLPSDERPPAQERPPAPASETPRV